MTEHINLKATRKDLEEVNKLAIQRENMHRELLARLLLHIEHLYQDIEELEKIVSYNRGGTLH